MAIASAEGQRIWTIDQTNLNTALAAINLDTDIENEICSAVNAGKIVTAHDTPVAFAGSTVTGYLLIDPTTGAGAYKVGGGQNGAWLFWGTIIFLGIMLYLALMSGNIIGAAFILLAYNSFLNRVEAISGDLTPEQTYSELNRAAFLAVAGSFAGLALGRLGPIGGVMTWYLRGFLLAFGLTWYG
ncbi:MAG: hypothetical protein L3K25_17985 [Gammaproteobacteria bacterium]|nr:hypothetical protein [Gammaproteobacteria bacterium]